MKKYNLIVCGGTFDLLHQGHISFLEQTFDLSEKVIIGLTSDSYVSEFKSQNMENFETRKDNLISFLNNKFSERFEIQKTDDIYGPLLDKNFEIKAIAVTPQTDKAVIKINEEREKIGLPKLAIEIVEMEMAEDAGFISSTRIRSGEISRSGKLYVDSKWKNKNLKLPEELREAFKKPIGEIILSVPQDLDGLKIITIGDVSTNEFNRKKVYQTLSIIDFQVQREKKYSDVSELGFDKDIEVINVKNNPGELNGKLFEIIKNALYSGKRHVILIDGEEDLVFVAVALVSPLGFRIYYGQPNVGMVDVEVTEDVKEKVYYLVSKFNY